MFSCEDIGPLYTRKMKSSYTLDALSADSHSTNMTSDEEWLLNEKYGGVESSEFSKDRDRLAAGEPLAYVIGHVPFLDTTIHLDSHPLIPRPETEYWAEEAIEVIRSSGLTLPRILDLCAGSGAIGIAVANAIPEAHVTFAEIDKTHLATIAKNLDVNGISCTRYQVFESDLFSNVTGIFDFILSNPPYIDPVLDRTEASVKNFEPHQALYGGHEGLALIERIIADAGTHLSSKGELWIEHEPEQSERIHEIALASGFIASSHTDQYGTERYSILSRAH